MSLHQVLCLSPHHAGDINRPEKLTIDSIDLRELQGGTISTIGASTIHMSVSTLWCSHDIILCIDNVHVCTIILHNLVYVNIRNVNMNLHYVSCV